MEECWPDLGRTVCAGPGARLTCTFSVLGSLGEWALRAQTIPATSEGAESQGCTVSPGDRSFLKPALKAPPVLCNKDVWAAFLWLPDQQQESTLLLAMRSICQIVVKDFQLFGGKK